jgi:hypothetical protein
VTRTIFYGGIQNHRLLAVVFVVMVFGRGGADNDGDNNDNNWSIKNEANQYSFKLFCEDFQQVPRPHIPDHSIVMILTDPPYSEEYLYLYEDQGD